MIIKLSILFNTCFSLFCFAQNYSIFDNYKVYRVIPINQDQLRFLLDLNTDDITKIATWKLPSTLGKPADYLIHDDYYPEFKRSNRDIGLNSQLQSVDVKKIIETQRPRRKTNTFGWNDYHQLDDIYDWLKHLEEKFNDKVEIVEGGESFEGRKILGIHLNFGGKKKGVFLEGGIHAREWISPATVTFILNELLTNKDPKIREIVESRDWWIFPSVNPDGYAYTHQNPLNRVWRKNRRPNLGCTGVDLNRNWGYHWRDGSSSSNPCSDLYAGKSSSSEIETTSFERYIKSLEGKLEVYLAFHSFSQFLLLPYAHGGDEKSDNYEELWKIGNKTIEAIGKRYGTKYIQGRPIDLLYAAGGSSMDYVKHLGIRIVYTYELRPAKNPGFLLPPEEIVPTGQETFDSIIAMLKEIDL